VKKSLFASARSSFFTGLVIVLPGIITLAVVKWFFGTIASLTDSLLFFLPPEVTHKADGTIHWYWSLFAIIFTVLAISIIGGMTRYYIGKRLIAWADSLMLRVPVLNKIYGTIKQVDEAFTSSKKSSFKTVVLVEYPREGIYSVGFITSEHEDEISKMTREKCVAVFIPTTPIPTSGFLILIPVEKITKLDISVADGFKYIISLGALTQEPAPPLLKNSRPKVTRA
jgi:uncharacterized membrane protein